MTLPSPKLYMSKDAAPVALGHGVPPAECVEAAEDDGEVQGDWGEEDEEEEQVADTLVVPSPGREQVSEAEPLVVLLLSVELVLTCTYPGSLAKESDSGSKPLHEELPTMRKQLDALFARISEAEASLFSSSPAPVLATPPAPIITPTEKTMAPARLQEEQQPLNRRQRRAAKASPPKPDPVADQMRLMQLQMQHQAWMIKTLKEQSARENPEETQPIDPREEQMRQMQQQLKEQAQLISTLQFQARGSPTMDYNDCHANPAKANSTDPETKPTPEQNPTPEQKPAPEQKPTSEQKPASVGDEATANVEAERMADDMTAIIMPDGTKVLSETPVLPPCMLHMAYNIL